MKYAIYRGWMMKPEQYENFYYKLIARNITLITTPEMYRLMHLFPNIYQQFGEDTAKLRLFSLHQRIEVEESKKDFDRLW